MIARFRAWLGARKQLTGEIDHQLATVAELDAVIGRLSGMLSTEQMTTAALDAEVKRLVRQNNVINLRADAAIAEATRLRADHTYVSAERCECGGDTELYWRKRAHELERQARQDRDNARRMEGKVEYWRQRVDEADRLVHIAEQLGRAG